MHKQIIQGTKVFPHPQESWPTTHLHDSNTLLSQWPVTKGYKKKTHISSIAIYLGHGQMHSPLRHQLLLKYYNKPKNWDRSSPNQHKAPGSNSKNNQHLRHSMHTYFHLHEEQGEKMFFFLFLSSFCLERRTNLDSSRGALHHLQFKTIHIYLISLWTRLCFLLLTSQLLNLNMDDVSNSK